MLRHVGVIGRALVGEVDGDVHAVLPGPPHEAVEVLDRPQLRVNGLVPTFRAADGPGASWIVGLGPDGVVLALAVRRSDRVDGREVDHVEVHAGDILQPLLGFGEGPVAAGLRRAGPGEHLVPRAEPRLLPIDHHDELLAVAGRQAPVRIPVHQGQERRVERRLDGLVRTALDPLDPGPERPGVLAGGATGGPGDHLLAGRQLDRHLLTGAGLLLQVPAPSPESIHPGPKGVPVPAQLGYGEGRTPPVVLDERHPDVSPDNIVVPAEPHIGSNGVVPVGEDVRLHGDPFAHHPLDREAAAVDLGLHALDDHATPSLSEPHQFPRRSHRQGASRLEGSSFPPWMGRFKGSADEGPGFDRRPRPW